MPFYCGMSYPALAELPGREHFPWASRDEHLNAGRVQG